MLLLNWLGQVYRYTYGCKYFEMVLELKEGHTYLLTIAAYHHMRYSSDHYVCTSWKDHTSNCPNLVPRKNKQVKASKHSVKCAVMVKCRINLLTLCLSINGLLYFSREAKNVDIRIPTKISSFDYILVAVFCCHFKQPQLTADGITHTMITMFI